MDVGLSIGAIAVPLMAKRLFQASPLALGLLAAIGSGAYVLGTPLAGHISDRIGRSAIMLLGAIIFCADYALIGICPSLRLLFLLIVLSGISQAMFWPALEAAIADGTPPSVLPTRVGIFNICWCSGIILGTWMGGRFHDISPRLPFAVAVAIGLAIIPVILIPAPAVDPASSADKAEEGPGEDPFSPDQALRQRFMYMAWGANLVAWAILGTMRALFAPDVTVRLAFTGQKAALLVATISMTQTAVFVALMIFHGWRYRFWFFALMQLCMMGGAGLVAFSVSSVPLAAGFLLIGTGAGVTYTSSIYYSLEGLHGRGAKSGIHEAFLGGGVLAGPLLGGWLATATGDIRAPYFMCVGLVIVGLALQVGVYLCAQAQKK
jgi:MFS family permease